VTASISDLIVPIWPIRFDTYYLHSNGWKRFGIDEVVSPYLDHCTCCRKATSVVFNEVI
jgi:hypothetical protein